MLTAIALCFHGHLHASVLTPNVLVGLAPWPLQQLLQQPRLQPLTGGPPQQAPPQACWPAQPQLPPLPLPPLLLCGPSRPQLQPASACAPAANSMSGSETQVSGAPWQEHL